MPLVLANKLDIKNFKSVETKINIGKYKERYPNGVDLKPGTELHDDIVRTLRTYITPAYENNIRRKEWDEVDKMLRVYVKSDKDLKKKRKEGEIDKIVLPTTYINLETILSYMMAALMPDPIWNFIATGPEDQLKANILTELVALHSKRFGIGESLITCFRSMFAYGIGPAHAVWKTDKESGFDYNETTKKRVKRTYTFEGNDIVPIDPRTFVCDPNVPITRFQDGDYVSWIHRKNYTYLHSLERESNNIFNVDYILTEKASNFVNVYFQTKEDSPNRFAPKDPISMPIDVTYIYANIIPKYWGLSNSESPEKWFFCIAGQNILIAANKLRSHHGKYPIAIGAPDSDGFSNAPASRLGYTQEIQQYVNFLFSSHIANIKSAINNSLIVDPFTINMADVRDPGPGKIIRTKKAVWGRGVGDYVKQLNVVDVTSGNMNNVQFLQDLSRQVTKATDQAQGNLVNRGPRISASQAQNAFASSLGGLEKDAYRIGVQFMQPLGKLFISHTQQNMKEDVFLTVAGNLAQSIREVFPDQKAPNNQITADFSMILGSPFDVEVRDGSIPGKEDANSWIQFLQVAGAIPQVLSMLDLRRVILAIGRSLGVKSVDQFLNTQVEVLPEEELNRQIRSGNLNAL
jgi:hypothetical protein